MSSSSLSFIAFARDGTSPDVVLSAMSRMARIFPAENPEPRNSSSLVSSTCSGFGKRTPGNSALNRRRIDSAAFA